MGTDRGLTPKQAAFVREYLVDLNATQAAERAGYSAATAQQMGAENLSKPLIREAIEAGKAERASRVEMTADDVLRGLLLEARREGEGSSHGARVRAWETLGKHLGMFAERSKVEVSGDVNVSLSHLVDRYKRLATESEDSPSDD